MEARDLPVMDSRSELTDAYVEVKFGDEMFRTPVCRKTLCPIWNADFRFELEDNEIQDEILEVKYGCVCSLPCSSIGAGTSLNVLCLKIDLASAGAGKKGSYSPLIHASEPIAQGVRLRHDQRQRPHRQGVHLLAPAAGVGCALPAQRLVPHIRHPQRCVCVCVLLAVNFNTAASALLAAYSCPTC